MQNYTLKRYVVTKSFGPYKEGAVVAFHGEDAKRFAENVKEFKEKEDANTADGKKGGKEGTK